jgi:hypothetical protein
MTPRDRVISTLNHQPVDRAPRDLCLLQSLETQFADAVAEMGIRFPTDIAQIDVKSPHGKRHKAAAARPANQYADAWGCTWHIGPQGGPAAIHESPLADESKIAAYAPPAEMLDAARFAAASQMADHANRFALAWSDVQPLGRALALRGPDVAMAELIEGNKALRQLLTRLHEHFCREMELWADSGVDGVVIRDDLGAAGSLRVTSKLWRQVLKPMYRQYCEILRAKDKFVFFYSDGKTSDFFGELVELGFDAIHVQTPAADLEHLAESYRGQVTFWIEFGTERIAPPSTHEDIREEVRQVRRFLDFGSGLIARCDWAPGTPMRNVVAFFEEWMMPLPAGA